MSNGNISIKPALKSRNYEIAFAQGILDKCGAWAADCLKSPDSRGSKIAVISNAKVYGLYGERVRKSLEDAGFGVSTFLMKDGERYKNLRSLENVLEFLGQNRLSRADAVIALGGGVAGDLAGFAASIYVRGIPFLQIPTTLLAMIDSSVGGKTAVNTSFGKNLVGSFYQPGGVLIDVRVLETLERRELTAGFCEAVKQGAIAGPKLFDSTARFLERYPVANFEGLFSDGIFLNSLEDLIRGQVAFKAKIVRQDETEDLNRSDCRSRKILNFGHTLAHALEKVTNYRYLKHGEAVGHGILFAAELSKRLDLLGQNELNSLNDVVHRAGKLPDISNIDAKDIFEAFKFDKKSTGNTLQWILLKDIGEPAIVSDSDISHSAKKKALDKILQK
jgi:3-dehydroquinate synthase